MTRKWQNVSAFGFLLIIISCLVGMMVILYNSRRPIHPSILNPLYWILIILMAVGATLVFYSAIDDKDVR